MHTLWLLRHAEAAAFAPGRPDAERPLTEAGLTAAAQVGRHLREADPLPDLVISSSALRTRQTAEALQLACPTRIEQRLYNAGSETVLQIVQEVSEEPTAILVVGHAPGIPALAHELGDPQTSSAAALARIERGYPTATLCRLTFDHPWAELTSARLTEATLFHGQQ